MEGDKEWNKFKKSETYKNRFNGTEDYDYYDKKYLKSSFSKTSFITGLFSGFQDKLEKREKEILTNLSVEGNNLPISLNDPLLQEKYKSHYNPRSWSRQSSMNKGDGYYAGKNIGSSLTIRSGVRSNNSPIKLLSA